MAYYHILSHPGASTSVTLRFKDLSEDQLRTTFRQHFPNPSRSDVSVIRTERPHDVAVADYLRDYWQKVEEFMRVSGQHVSQQPLGDSAIKGAGVNITETLIREVEDEPRGLHGLTPGDLY
jgi:hypothetical protein